MLMSDPKQQSRHRAARVPLSPLSFIRQAAKANPDGTAVVYGLDRRSWAEVYARCFAFAGALQTRGIGRGSTVAILSANLPEMFEAHFSVPMSGATLCTLSPRLEPGILAEMLDQSGAAAVIVDPAFAPLLAQVYEMAEHRDILTIEIEDPTFESASPTVGVGYEEFLDEASPDFSWTLPLEEDDPITLCFGATIKGQRGVVHSHRAAFLNTQSFLRLWNLPRNAVTLAVLPLHRANGWGLPWAIASVAGTFVCQRCTLPETMFQLIETEKVSHFCSGADRLVALSGAAEAMGGRMPREVQVLSSGRPLAKAALDRLEHMGFRLTQALGLPEAQGPILLFESEHADYMTPTSAAQQLQRSSTAGSEGMQSSERAIATPGVIDLKVADPMTRHPVPSDGQTLGEIFILGSGMMQEYHKDPQGTDSVFADSWLATNLMAVRHVDGSIDLSGAHVDGLVETRGEVLDTREVTSVLESHKMVRAAAVVTRMDPMAGPVPCAFIELRRSGHVSRRELVSYCRERLARFKVPHTIIFGPLPRTPAGQVDTMLLQQRAHIL